MANYEKLIVMSTVHSQGKDGVEVKNVSNLFLVTGHVITGLEDRLVPEEVGGLAHHAKTVVEEDEVGRDEADLGPVPEVAEAESPGQGGVLLAPVVQETVKTKTFRLKRSSGD